MANVYIIAVFLRNLLQKKGNSEFTLYIYSGGDKKWNISNAICLVQSSILF